MEKILLDYDEATPRLSDSLELSIRTNLTTVLNYLEKPEDTVTIYFCSADSMRELNKQYRDLDKPTDILSWGYEEEMMQVGEPWGEMAVCLTICEQQARQSEWELETELLRLLIHGIAHILGYDHQTPEEEAVMLKLEKELLEQIGLTEIYPS